MKQELQELYDQIKHGDEEHQKWLYDKMEEFSERHEKFWQTDVGKIVSKFVHDHANAAGLIGWYAANIAKSENLNNYDRQYLEKLSKELKNCNNAVDYVYENIKKLEGY